MTLGHNRAKQWRRDEGRGSRLYSIAAIGKMRMEYIKMQARARKATQQQDREKAMQDGR